MKKYFLLLTFLAPFSLLAQCPFDPTVTPTNLILCPGSSDTIWTQPYDAYQWYAGNSQIPGATNQFYVVSSFDYYSVAATLDGCTEQSPKEVVDSWVFLLPYVIHSGDLGYFDPNLYATILCPGDTLILTMGLPYNTNVQWFNSGDSIAGATETELLVTESGVYTACGAPEVCPDYIQCLGVEIAVLFMNPTPLITQSNDTLLSNITANNYQWYYNGNVIAGATNYFYVPIATGEYSVAVTDAYGCSGTSLPYFITVTSIETPQNSFELFPTITSDLIFIKTQKRISFMTIYNELGNEVLYPSSDLEYIDVSELPAGVYILRAQFSEGIFCQKFIRY